MRLLHDLAWITFLVGSSSLLSAGASPGDASPSIAEIRSLNRDARFTEAEEQARARLQALETGRDSTRSILLYEIAFARIFGGKSRDDETAQVTRDLVELREQLHGRRHRETASALALLGNMHFNRSEFAEARELFEEVFGIRGDVLPPEHPETASSLNDLSRVHFKLGDYESAEKWAARAVKVLEDVDSKDESARGSYLISQGNAVLMLGDPAGARAIYEKACVHVQRAFGPDHPRLSTCLNNLAFTSRILGDFQEARDEYERVLEIREARLEPNHPLIARTLHSLSALEIEMGDLVRARALLARALRIQRGSLGEQHDNVAATLHTLSKLHYDLGDYGAAKKAGLASVHIYEAIHGTDYEVMASPLSVVGSALLKMGDAEAAAAYQERALALRENALGPGHPLLVGHLVDVAEARRESGEAGGTKALLEHARAICDTSDAVPPLAKGRVFHALALAAWARGDSLDAVANLEHALHVLESGLGPSHPGLASPLRTLAQLHMTLGHPETAFELALRCEEISRDHLRLTIQALPEHQSLLYASRREQGLDVLLALLERTPTVPVHEVWSAVIASRATVLEEIAERNRWVAGSFDAEVARLAENLASARETLAGLIVRGPEEDTAESFRDALEAAMAEKESAETALAEKSAAFRQALVLRHTTSRQIDAQLEPSDALIAYALFRRDDPFAPASPAFYMAFVARPAEEPVAVPLGPARDIAELVRSWNRSISEAAALEPAGAGSETGDDRTRELGAALRGKLWDPLAEVLGEPGRVFIVPDGVVSFVNFAALPTGTDSYLLETGPLIHHLTSERDLLPVAASAPGGGLLALGDPSYGLKPAPSTGGETALRGQRPRCRGFASLRFEALPASAEEVREIGELWRKQGGTVTTLTGIGASEASFKAEAPGRRGIHLATHGFFLGEECLPSERHSRGVGAVVTDKAPPDSFLPENPLLSSGLALAGANLRGETDPGEDDGILTAEEIAALDLSGVEWAILSACGTGLGEVQAGEGVLGLQRAFRTAGVQTLVISLWPVDDEATRSWMRVFYRAKVAHGLSVTAAVREAGLSVLESLRASGRSTHPFRWGGFISSGRLQ